LNKKEKSILLKTNILKASENIKSEEEVKRTINIEKKKD